MVPAWFRFTLSHAAVSRRRGKNVINGDVARMENVRFMTNSFPVQFVIVCPEVHASSLQSRHQMQSVRCFQIMANGQVHGSVKYRCRHG